MTGNHTKTRVDKSSLVSVVMPSFRMGPFIGEALRGVAAQTHAAWEVIVVDDHAPEDGTKAIVQAFAAEHPRNRVVFHRHEHNQGVSAARNSAVALAQGELIAFLDPDDLWLPGHLQMLVERFNAMEGLDVATGPVEAFDDGPGGKPPRTWPIADWQVRFFPATLALNNFIQPSATVVRRSSLLKVGGFDTDPGLQHIEDYDLWIRLVEDGCRFSFLHTPTSRYRRHDGAASSDERRMQTLHDRLHAKHSPFFRSAHARLFVSMQRRMEKLEQEVGHVNIERHGPLMRIIRALDALVRALVRKVRGRI